MTDDYEPRRHKDTEKAGQGGSPSAAQDESSIRALGAAPLSRFLCVSVVLAFRRVITFFVAHLQLVRLAIVVHVEIGNFDAQLVKLSIRLPDFWNEPDTVLIPQVGTNHLVDAGILALEPWEPRRPARCLGKGTHDIV